MYVYLYDNFLRQRKFASFIKSLEIRLTDYGISGKVLRIQNYNDVRSLLDDEIKRGAQTIVIVGNDETFGHVLSRAAQLTTVFGFIPVGTNTNTIAPVLGIPIGIEACRTLSKRRREYLDVGLVNNRYFISQVHVVPSRIQVTYDAKFTVSADQLMELVVCNLQPFYWRTPEKGSEEQVIHPQDGKLEAFLRPLTKKRWWGYKFEEPSIFPFQVMDVRAREPFTVEVDGRSSRETQLTIRLAGTSIDMIVGKERKF
jgi:diacylglycerol kinase family enzyme